MNSRQKRKVVDDLGLITTVIVRPSGCLACPYSSPYSTNTCFCPAGISVDDEMNFTFDMSTTFISFIMEFPEGASISE
jgi:hypothetical protein